MRAVTRSDVGGIALTNLSVNPARSMGPAVFVGGWALAQLWLFWVAPRIMCAIVWCSRRTGRLAHADSTD